MATAQGIPTRMRAAAMDHFGSPDVIHTETLPVPSVGTREVLVQVECAGVGEWDPEIVDGSLQDAKVRFPRVIGSDGAGTIVAVGKGVNRFSVGDRVYGWGFGNAKGGFFAEYIAINEKEIAPIPEGMSFNEAGALAVSGITAMIGLEKLDVDEGDRIVVFGASGGVGHVALQLAKHMGLLVFAVASRDDGVELVRRLGADGAAEGRSKTLVKELREFAPRGFAGAIVFTGGSGWKRALELVNKGGKVTFPNGVEPLPSVPRGVKRIAFDGKGSAAAFKRLNELIERGPFHVEIAKAYSLDAAAQALKEIEDHHVGKLEIVMRGDGKRVNRRQRA